jgi:hypothetical protein
MQLRQIVIKDPHLGWAHRALRAIDAQYMDALSVLAFNPTERSRLGVAMVKPPEQSTLDRIASRRAHRA